MFNSSPRPRKQGPATFGKLQPFAKFEGVIVRDDDLGAVDVAEHVFRDQFPVFVIAVRVVRLKHAETIFDGEAGRHDEEASGESCTAGVADGVDGLPGDDHRHDGGLAGPGGQLQCQAHQFRIGVIVGVGEVFEKPLASVAAFRGDLGQPDRSLGSFDLTKEWPDPAELVVPPMLEEALGFGLNQPVIRIFQIAPIVNVASEFIDDGRWIVLLLFGGKPSALVENDRLLISLRLDLAWLWNRSDELRAATGINDPLRRLAVDIEFPMGGRVLIGRVENGPLKKLVVHIEQ